MHQQSFGKREPNRSFSYRSCLCLASSKLELSCPNRLLLVNQTFLLFSFSLHEPVKEPVNKQNCLCQSFLFSLCCWWNDDIRKKKATFNEIIKLHTQGEMNKAALQIFYPMTYENFSRSRWRNWKVIFTSFWAILLHWCE